MIVLGVDYGTSKVGLAIGHTDTKVATPLSVVKPEDLAMKIERLVETEGINLVVFGLPLSLTGEETASAKAVKEFALKLEQEISAPIVFEDERMTTSQAKRDGHDDAVAAMYLLQSYLDRNY